MNQWLFQAVHAIAGTMPVLDAFMIVSASAILYLMAVAFIIGAFALFFNEKNAFIRNKKRFYFLMSGALATLVSWGLVARVIHFIYPHAPPFAALGFKPLIVHMADPSFPSDHATFLFALAMIMWQENRRWGWYFFIAAALNAFSRVYVGVHWPSDVIAGAVIGIAAAIAVKKSMPRDILMR